MSAQMFGSAVDVVSAELVGDDQITAQFSRLIAGEISVRWAGNLLEVLEVLFGVTIVSSGVTPDQVEHLRVVGGSRLPYVGMIGQGLAEEGLGDMLVFVPKLKPTSQIRLTNMEYGAWQIAEFTARAVSDQDWGIVNIVRRETTDDTIVMPPAGLVAIGA